MFVDQPTSQSSKAKSIAIFNMALDFASMTRVFKSATKEQFLTQVHYLLKKIINVNNSDEFDTYHDEFCTWGMCSIKSKEKAKNSHASYGQVAKTLNVVLKVVVFYCNLPDPMIAKKIVPFLHPAIDTEMMKYLRKNYRNDFPTNLSSLASVNKNTYLQLIELAAKDMKKKFDEVLYLVQWGDIIWVRVNAKK